MAKGIFSVLAARHIEKLGLRFAPRIAFVCRHQEM